MLFCSTENNVKWDCTAIENNHDVIISIGCVKKGMAGTRYDQCYKWVEVSHLWVWFEPHEWFGLVPDLSNNPTRFALVRNTSTRTFEPVGLPEIGLTQWFQSPVSHLGLFNFWSCWDIILSIAKYQWWYLTVLFGCIGHLRNQKDERHIGCPILKICINGASIIVDHASWVLWVAIGCRSSGTGYCPPLKAQEEATCSLPHLENECQQSINDFWLLILGNLRGACLQSGIKNMLSASLGRWARDSSTTACRTVATYFI